MQDKNLYYTSWFLFKVVLNLETSEIRHDKLDCGKEMHFSDMSQSCVRLTFQTWAKHCECGLFMNYIIAKTPIHNQNVGNQIISPSYIYFLSHLILYIIYLPFVIK